MSKYQIEKFSSKQKLIIFFFSKPIQNYPLRKCLAKARELQDNKPRSLSLMPSPHKRQSPSLISLKTYLHIASNYTSALGLVTRKSRPIST